MPQVYIKEPETAHWFAAPQGFSSRALRKALMSNLFEQIIRNTRLRIGEPPRSFAPSERHYLESRSPIWCRPNADELHTIYADQKLLLTQGIVVWGHLLQANSALFARGNDDLPGASIYSPELHLHDDLTRLASVSEEVTALRQGGGKNPREKEIGKWLADERTTFMAHPVPASIAGATPVLSSCHMFIRKHLPGGKLTTSYFPLLVHPATKAVLIVPARYWDPEFVKMWTQP